jgi:hypothetical protein
VPQREPTDQTAPAGGLRDPGPAADERDRLADGRDDTAAGHDRNALGRDSTALNRDDDARTRDTETASELQATRARLHDLRSRIVARLRRLEDQHPPPDGPDPVALDEQRRLAAQDRMAIESQFDELVDVLDRTRLGRRTAAGERSAAAEDRRAAAGDRDHSADDRDDSAADRGQAAIERAQIDHRTVVPDPSACVDPDGSTGPPAEALAEQTAWAIATSQQRIDESRETLGARSASSPLPRPDPGERDL